MRNIYLLILMALCLRISAQDYPGYSLGNYAGVHGIYAQPASIADSRFKVDVNLLGVHAYMGNNYLSFNREDAIQSLQDAQFDLSRSIKSYEGNSQKYFWSDVALYAPSFMVTLSEKHAFALSSRARNKFHIDNVDRETAKLIQEQFEYPSLWARPLENSHFGIQNMSWNEYAITYARVLMNKEKHFLKAGVTPKLVHGVMAFYLFADNLRFMVSNSDTLTLIDSHINYGHSDNFEFSQGEVSYNINTAPAPALDLGFVYEWRPDYKESQYDMDGETGLWRRDRNKYKLRIGAALTDLGSIRFKNGPLTGDFRANINNWNIEDIDFESVQAFDDTIRNRFEQNGGGGYFNMKLPTALNLQIDYNIWKGFYVNLSPYYAMKFDNVPHKVHGVSAVTLTPRWENKWLGVYLPVTWNEHNHSNVGLDLMFGPFVLGTNDLLSYVSKENISALDLHLFARIPIYFNRTKDRDNDKVSDKLDRCKDVPGVWEFYGCPDRDGDHVEDAVDNCPDEPGSPVTRGCPDTDNDGVVNNLDECPDVYGLAKLNGCPDRDNDGIMDRDDRCPEQPGTVEMSGCPDTDSDGIADYEDLCPDKPGPFNNLGCPETKLLAINDKGEVVAYAIRNHQGQFVFENLPPDENLLYRIEGEDTDFTFEVKVKQGNRERTLVKRKDGFFTYETLRPDEMAISEMDLEDVGVKLLREEEAVVKKAFDDLQFETGRASMRESSLASLDELASLMKKKPGYKIRLSGHTDNTGSYSVNMLLSKKRAEAVKEYLISKGISAGRIEVIYHGADKPVASNDTEEGRQQNRRVEMRIIE